MALVLRDLEQRATLRAVDRRRRGSGVLGDAGRFRADQAQQPGRRREPRVPDARRAGARRGTRGPRRRQAEAVDFADDGVPGDADLGGDLTAGQTGDDTVPELLDTLRSPSLDAHSSMLIKRPRGCGGRFWAADRARAARNRHRETEKSPKAQIRCAAAELAPRLRPKTSPQGSAHGAAITEPHPHLRDCQPAVFCRAPDRQDGPEPL
jgi:hypothetical protein